ncbi:hypothetical protein NL676_008143 [Syzygium grande]|nr:hypothetical protein NL676_008143 [Syzygium grande]
MFWHENRGHAVRFCITDRAGDRHGLTSSSSAPALASNQAAASTCAARWSNRGRPFPAPALALAPARIGRRRIGPRPPAPATTPRSAGRGGAGAATISYNTRRPPLSKNGVVETAKEVEFFFWAAFLATFRGLLPSTTATSATAAAAASSSSSSSVVHGVAVAVDGASGGPLQGRPEEAVGALRGGDTGPMEEDPGLARHVRHPGGGRPRLRRRRPQPPRLQGQDQLPPAPGPPTPPNSSAASASAAAAALSLDLNLPSDHHHHPRWPPAPPHRPQHNHHHHHRRFVFNEFLPAAVLACGDVKREVTVVGEGGGGGVGVPVLAAEGPAVGASFLGMATRGLPIDLNEPPPLWL